MDISSFPIARPDNGRLALKGRVVGCSLALKGRALASGRPLGGLAETGLADMGREDIGRADMGREDPGPWPDPGKSLRFRLGIGGFAVRSFRGDGAALSIDATPPLLVCCACGAETWSRFAISSHA
eukprot:889629-Rhodomonas_salina.3